MSLVKVAKPHACEDYLDSSVIDGLISVMPLPAVRALLEDVEGDVRLRIERLEEINVAQSSLGVIAQDAHDLKSIGGNFGLNTLSEQAGIVERAARSGCIETVRENLPSLTSTGLKSLEALYACSECNSKGVA